MAFKTSRSLACLSFLVLSLATFTGCQTPESGNFSTAGLSKPGQEPPKPEVIVLREGDSVRISFPGAPNLNSVQLIRRDGRITLPLIGEFQAAGLTHPLTWKKSC